MGVDPETGLTTTPRTIAVKGAKIERPVDPKAPETHPITTSQAVRPAPKGIAVELYPTIRRLPKFR